jgi:paraquat-inducible protein B
MKFDPEAFEKVATVQPENIGLSHQKMFVLFSNRIAELVEQGLRCQLQYGDITGTLFVDIAFFDPKENPPLDLALPPGHPPYIPAIPIATIGSIITEVNKITKNLAQINLKEISDSIKLFMQKSNQILDEQDFKKIFRQMESASENLNTLIVRTNEVFDKKRLENIVDNLQTTFKNINSTLVSIEKFSEETRNEIKNSKIADTTEKARNLLESSDTTMKNLNALKADLKNSIEEFNETLRAAKELFDYLERNPNSVLSGSPEKPVVKPE